MTVPIALPDAEARALCRTALDRSLLLEAAAGTGKTRVLVERALALLAAGEALPQVAVVTFLEEAAGELRHRLRREIDRARPAPWAEAALAAWPSAQVGTVHALALHLVRQFPLEAGLVPGDAPAARTAAQARADLEAYLRQRLDTPEGAAALVQARELGVPLGADLLARWAEALEEEDRPAAEPPSQDALEAQALAFRDALVEAAREAKTLQAACRDPADRAAGHARELGRLAHRLSRVDGERALLLEVLRLTVPSARAGSQKNWRPPEHLQRLRELLTALAQAQAGLIRGCHERLLHDLFLLLRDYPAFCRKARLARGELDPDDLLRAALRLVEGDGDLAARLRSRYRHLLVDEFQDTDPLQYRLVEALTRPPGALLFAVGDPKQAIYAFRGADLARYDQAAGQLAGQGPLLLTANFRSRPVLVQAVNRLLGEPFARRGRQAHLDPARGGSEGALAPLTVLAGDGGPPASRAEEARAREGAAVAQWLAQLLAQPPPIPDPEDGHLRPLRPADVALLFPTRAAYPAYLRALAQRGLRAQVDRSRDDGQRGVEAAFLDLLAAVAHPASPRAVAAALRGPFLGLSDADLTAYRLAGGALDASQPPPQRAAQAAPAVAEALALLGSLALKPEGAAAKVRQVLEAVDPWAVAVLWEGTEGPEALDRIWQAAILAEEEAPGLPLGTFLQRLADQSRPGAGREGWMGKLLAAGPAAALAQAGDRLVVRTVHSAKGREFPVVVLCGLGQRAPTPFTPVLRVRDPDARGARVALALSEGRLGPGGSELSRFAQEREAAERLNLLYVALTRAREALVLPDFPVGSSPSPWRTLLAEAVGQPAPGDGLADLLRAAGLEPAVWSAEGAAPEPSAPGPVAPVAAALAEAAAVRAALAEAGGRRRWPSAAAEDLPPGARPPSSGEEVDRAEAQAFGRAVHAALAQLLGSGAAAGIGAAALRAARREGAEGHLPELERQLAAALDLPLLRQALAAPRRRTELPFWSAEGEDLIVGRVDLLFEGPDGTLHLVDLKTDAVPPGGEEALAEGRGYPEQLRAYARAVRAAWPDRPVQGHLLFLRTGRDLVQEL